MRLRAEIYRQDEHIATVWGEVLVGVEFSARIHRLFQWSGSQVTARQAEDELCLLASVSEGSREALRWLRPQLAELGGLELCQECGADAEHPEADCARCQSAQAVRTKREAREKAELEARLCAEPVANDVEF